MQNQEAKSAESSARPTDPEIVQFSNGSMVLRYNKPGDRVNWDHKWAPGEMAPANMGIVRTQRGERFLIRHFELVRLADSRADGSGSHRLQHESMDMTSVYEIGDMPELILGQAWWPLGHEDDPVVEVVFRYKTCGERYPHAIQLDTSNPFGAQG